MAKIPRAAGITQSERYLAQLAERSFLDLWSYPNVYVDRRSNGPLTQGKELGDLLVVCGDFVLIFSDKSINWPEKGDIHLQWSRWYRRAVQKSADQVRGAARWIKEHPDRIFLDPACTQALPLTLPSPDRIRVHGIVVARGAGEACRSHFRGGSGSLRIDARLRDGEHVDVAHARYRPFSVGDVYADGPFIHVFDDITLDVVMRELDTISDFAEYLERKAAFVRSGALEYADGEENLLAYFLVHGTDAGHDFVKGDGQPFRNGEILRVAQGPYADLREHPRYIAKKQADRHSYVWDSLIKAFTKNILAGTLVRGPDWANQPEHNEHEVGVRYMALENRTQRRVLGAGVIDVLENSGGRRRFARGLLRHPNDPDGDVGYVFMTLEMPDKSIKDLTYDEYRAVRSSTLYGYVINTLKDNPHLSRVIGIATEPPEKFTGKKGASEDLVYMERPDWSEDLIAEALRFREHYAIFADTTLKKYGVHTDEYPDTNTSDAHFENPIPYNFERPHADQEARARRRTRARRIKAGLLVGTSSI